MITTFEQIMNQSGKSVEAFLVPLPYSIFFSPVLLGSVLVTLPPPQLLALSL